MGFHKFYGCNDSLLSINLVGCLAATLYIHQLVLVAIGSRRRRRRSRPEIALIEMLCLLEGYSVVVLLQQVFGIAMAGKVYFGERILSRLGGRGGQFGLESAEDTSFDVESLLEAYGNDGGMSMSTKRKEEGKNGKDRT